MAVIFLFSSLLYCAIKKSDNKYKVSKIPAPDDVGNVGNLVRI